MLKWNLSICVTSNRRILCRYFYRYCCWNSQNGSDFSAKYNTKILSFNYTSAIYHSYAENALHWRSNGTSLYTSLVKYKTPVTFWEIVKHDGVTTAVCTAIARLYATKILYLVYVACMGCYSVLFYMNNIVECVWHNEGQTM